MTSFWTVMRFSPTDILVHPTDEKVVGLAATIMYDRSSERYEYSVDSTDASSEDGEVNHAFGSSLLQRDAVMSCKRIMFRVQHRQCNA